MPVPLNIRDFLDRGAAAYSERVAVIDEPDQPAEPLAAVSYTALAELARRQAASLDVLGVARGARVAVLSHNSARMLTSFFGVSGWGRVLVPLNYRLAQPELNQILRHSGTEVLFADADCAEMAKKFGIEHTFVFGQDDDRIYDPHNDHPQEWREVDENASATLNYTSGTTGNPKGVQLTHRNLWLNAVTFALHTALTDRDVYLHTLPMFHANGWGMPYGITGVGAKHIVLRKVEGQEILRRIAQHGVTVLCAAPTVIDSVLSAAEEWPGEIPGRGTLRAIVAGAPPSTRTIARMETELGWEFIQIYGQTETSPLVTINRAPQEWERLDPHSRAVRLRRAGVPALGVRIQIDPSNGEILTRSNHNLASYWRDEELTTAVGAESWLHTGDVGRIAEDGSLEITDRMKDIVITGGENVSSAEVEDVLTTHPNVKEAAVIGTPDDRWGELVTALVVVGKDAVTADDLIEHCRTLLAGYKCPKKVLFVETLPRTVTGKLQKNRLRSTTLG